MDLFFSRHALFPFEEEIPPQWETSDLYAYLLKFYNFQENEWRISWISYDGLFIDDWRTEQVIVSGKVGVEYAHHFGDGTSPFPEQALLKEGMRAWDVDNLRDGNLIEEPINRSYGKHRHELASVAPGEPIPVSWSGSVWDYLGDDVASSFLNLRRFGADSELRVISTLS
jgi:hypothetical protein